MANPVLARIRRYLADAASPRPSEVWYGARWLPVTWDQWDDKYLSRGFRFRTGHAQDVFDGGIETVCTTLRVEEVVSSTNRLLDLRVEAIGWDFW